MAGVASTDLRITVLNSASVSAGGLLSLVFVLLTVHQEQSENAVLPGESVMKTAGAVAPLWVRFTQSPPLPNPFPLLIHPPPAADVRRGLETENELLYNEAQQSHPEKIYNLMRGFNEGCVSVLSRMADELRDTEQRRSRKRGVKN